MGFDRICLLGVGLMGGSLGLACRKRLSGSQIVGYGHKPDELRLAVQRGAIDRATADPAEAVGGADLVVLCTPVGVFASLLKSIAPALKGGAIVTDVGSTKRSVVKLAEQLLPPGAHFVGSHPMTGAETHGIENAREDLLADALCLVTPSDSTNAAALERVEGFWQSLKMRTARLTPEIHDRLTADISHLPHVIAAALVRMQSPQSLSLAAGGFRDTTRIAAGNPGLWTDILLDNRENLREGITKLQADLHQLLARLDANDAGRVRDWLTAAAESRAILARSKGKSAEAGA